MLHIPILRAGQPYRSLQTTILDHVKTGEPVVEVSLANRGLISRDLRDAPCHRELLQRVPSAELIAICRRAAEIFVNGEVAVDPSEGTTQTAEDYVRCLSATTGMPLTLCRGNMEKIRFVLAEMERVIAGLTRGVDLSVLDRGYVEQDGRTLSYVRQADNLGAVLPSNSPGVHSLWMPALAMKVPLVLKPGSREPWTPVRIAQSLLAAGCPPGAISLYPSDYAGAAEILLRCDRSMFFGDASSIVGWKDDPRVQLHGPGWSKLILADSGAEAWNEHLDLMQTSVAENGGRSCINASGIWTTAHGLELAEALADRLSRIEARPLDHPEASLAAFSDPRVAHRVSEYIDQQLRIPGAVDLTANRRPSGRVAEVDGCTFLLPTVIWCEDRHHPLAAAEFMFPFVSVVEAPANEMLASIGPTLVVTALTEDANFAEELMVAREIDRLNLGPLPTSRVSWDQPHEGNLFEELYKQRAFQKAAVSAA